MVGPVGMPDALKCRRMASYSSKVNFPLAQAGGKGLPQGVKDPGRVALPGQGRQGRLDERDDGEEIVVLGAGRQDGMAADEVPLEQLNLGGQRHVAQARREPVHAGQELAGQVGPRGGLLLGSAVRGRWTRFTPPHLCAVLVVVVTSPIIPTRPRGVNRRRCREGPLHECSGDCPGIPQRNGISSVQGRRAASGAFDDVAEGWGRTGCSVAQRTMGSASLIIRGTGRLEAQGLGARVSRKTWKNDRKTWDRRNP